MHRRSLLVAVGSLAGLAGCLDGDDAATTRTERSPDGTVATATDTGTPSATAASEFGLEITTPRYVVESSRVQKGAGEVSPEDVVPESELPSALREALAQARGGQFETETVSEDLLSAIDQFRNVGLGYGFDPYVRIGETAYEFDPSVPVFTARLVPDVDDHDPDRTIEFDHDDVGDDDELEDFVGTLTVASTHDVHATYHMSVPPESVLAFVDEYDYVEEPGGVGRIETERVDPGPPYTIDVRELTEVDFYGEPIADGPSLPADDRAFLETVVASDRLAHLVPPGRRQYPSDDPPPTDFRSFTAGVDASTPYVRLDGTVYQFFGSEFRSDAAPVSLAAEAATTGDDGPPRFTLTATVDDDASVDGEVKLTARGGLPAVLGVQTETGHVVVGGVDHGEYRWSERQDQPAGRYITSEERQRLRPGESVSANYEMPTSLSGGTHHLWGQFQAFARSDALDGSSRHWGYPFQVRVTLGDD